MAKSKPRAGGPPRRRLNTDLRPREHLEPDEADQLIKAAAKLGRNGLRDATMILLAYAHGLRAAEAVRLRWDHIHLSKEDIWIERLKGSKSGMHPLTDPELKALRKMGPRPRGFLFLAEGKEERPLSTRHFRTIVARAAEAAGLGDLEVHPHMLRHACGYRMHGEGQELRTIMAWLGHKVIQNTVRYTELDTEHFRKVGLGRKRSAG